MQIAFCNKTIIYADQLTYFRFYAMQMDELKMQKAVILGAAQY